MSDHEAGRQRFIIDTDVDVPGGQRESPPLYTAQASSANQHIVGAEVTDNGRVEIDLNSKLCRTLSLLAPLDNQPQPVSGDKESIEPPPYSSLQIPHTRLNIVIQVVGSRGDVQPFIALGNQLRRDGHRVRLATHNTFSETVRNAGLEFYPIGGDPAELMAYMVKNPSLIPSMQSLRAGDIQKKRMMIAQMLQGCWDSCLQPDPYSQEPFTADAIIANPPSFAHIHCAQALGIPVHLVFTMPWTTTRDFCHPLANLSVDKGSIPPGLANQLSYLVVEWMTWQGLGDIINDWRQTLDLEDIPFSEGPGLAETLRVPFTYCWSPALIPKPLDWPSHIDVCGFFFREQPGYTPDPDLERFLAEGPEPIYIGFGSIVIDDPESLTATLLEAIEFTGVRAIISRGWSNLGASHPASKNILYLGDCPHEWLFQRVKAVVHHGGAGTTACGLINGRPTSIVPFFGDQPFWGEMVHAAGAGPLPIPYKSLNSQNLADAIRYCLRPEALAAAGTMGQRMQQEDGVKQAVNSFYANLPWEKMQCDILPEFPASWTYKKGGRRLKLSKAAAAILTEGDCRMKRSDLKHLETRPVVIQRRRYDPITAATSSTLKMYFGIATSAANIVIKPVQAFTAERPDTSNGHDIPVSHEDPVYGRFAGLQVSQPSTRSHTQPQSSRAGAAIAGSMSGVGGVFKAFTKSIFLDIPHAIEEGMRVAPRLYNSQVYDPGVVTDWKSGGIAAGKNFSHGVVEGIGGLFVAPVKGAKEEGAIGAAKGLGTGVLDFTTKVSSGALGLFTFTSQGAYMSARSAMHKSTLETIMRAKRAEGFAYLQGRNAADAETVLRVFDQKIAAQKART